MSEESKDIIKEQVPIVIEKSKGFLKFIYKYRIYLYGVILIFVISSSTWIGGYFPRDSVIKEIVTSTTTSVNENTKNQMKEKEKEIELLEEMLQNSSKRVEDLNETILKLRKEKDNVQVPKNIKEIKNMSNKLGYPTL